MSAQQLRPLSQTEILDRGFKIAVRNYRRLVSVAAMVFVPVLLLGLLIVKMALPNGAQVVDGQIWVQSDGDLSVLQTGLGIAIAVGVMGYFVAIAAMHFAIGDVYLGDLPSVKGSVTAAGNRLGWIVLTILMVLVGLGAPLGLAVLIGAAAGTAGLVAAVVFCVVYGYWFLIASSLAIPALMREDVNGVDAIKRSLALVKDHWRTVFVITLATNLLLGIAGGIANAAFSQLLQGVLGEHLLGVAIQRFAPLVLAELITAPVMVAVITVVYFDLRVRKEGYDLEMLARESGMAPAAPAPTGMPAPAFAGPQLNAPLAAPLAPAAVTVPAAFAQMEMGAAELPDVDLPPYDAQPTGRYDDPSDDWSAPVLDALDEPVVQGHLELPDFWDDADLDEDDAPTYTSQAPVDEPADDVDDWYTPLPDEPRPATQADALETYEPGDDYDDWGQPDVELDAQPVVPVADAPVAAAQESPPAGAPDLAAPPTPTGLDALPAFDDDSEAPALRPRWSEPLGRD